MLNGFGALPDCLMHLALGHCITHANVHMLPN
jgi:hypothetical protein